MLLRPSLSSLSSFALSQLSSEPFTMAPAVVARRFMAQLQLLYRKCTVSCFFMWSGAGMAGSRLKRSRSTDGHSSGAPGSCPVLKKNANSSCLLYHSGSRKDSLLDLYHCKLSSKQIVRRCDECTATGLCFFFFFFNSCSGKSFTNQQVRWLWWPAISMMAVLQLHCMWTVWQISCYLEAVQSANSHKIDYYVNVEYVQSALSLPTRKRQAQHIRECVCVCTYPVSGC